MMNITYPLLDLLLTFYSFKTFVLKIIPVADSFWCLAKLIECFRFKNKIKLKNNPPPQKNKDVTLYFLFNNWFIFWKVVCSCGSRLDNTKEHSVECLLSRCILLSPPEIAYCYQHLDFFLYVTYLYISIFFLYKW